MSNLWVFNDDNSGLKYALADEILLDYENLFKRIFKDINTEASTPIGQIISALAQDDLNLIDKMRETCDYFFNGGSGLMLDIWAYNNFRIVRKNAIPSNVLVTIWGLPKTIIPKGFSVSDGKMIYYTEMDYIIPLLGEIDILFIAKEIYSQASLSNTITKILTPIENIDKVNNSNPSNIGLERETDSQLYKRCMELGSTFRNASLRSILSNIAQLDNVIKVAGFENKTNKPITERNVTIEPHSFIAIVLGGDDTDIATSISYSKPVGAGTTGNTAIEILVNNRKTIYKFERPTYLALKVNVACKLYLNSPKSYVDIIKDATIAYIETLQIGDYITQPNLSKALSQQAYNFDITDIKIGIKSYEVVIYTKFTPPKKLYEKTGGGSLPANYQLYTPANPLYYIQNEQYVLWNKNLYTLTSGNESGELTALRTEFYTKSIETRGGEIGYTPIQLDLNALALINRDDIVVSGNE